MDWKINTSLKVETFRCWKYRHFTRSNKCCFNPSKLTQAFHMFHWTVEIQLLIHPWHLFSFKVQIYGPPHFTCPGPAFGASWPRNKTNALPQTTATTVTDVTVGYLQDSQARPVSPFLQNICGRWSQHFGCLSARGQQRLTMERRQPVRAGGNGWQQDIHGDAMGCQSWGFDWPFNDQNDQNQGISWPEPADIPMYHPVVSGGYHVDMSVFAVVWWSQFRMIPAPFGEHFISFQK